MTELLAENACVTLKQLAVSGRDLMQAGVPAGKQIGVVLNALLVEVMDEKTPNEQESLLQRAKQLQAAGGVYGQME